MNKLNLALWTVLLLTASCKKDDDNAPSPGGGGGGTDTTGTNGDGLVTSWSPLKPYPDDVITLTGGPFNTTVAQNTVVSQSQNFDIISVSSTQLVVQPPPNWAPNTGGFSTIYIQSGTGADTLYPVYWKRRMNVISMEDNLDDFNFGAPARPGDSIVVYGSGFTPTGMSVNINGEAMPGPFFVDSAFYSRVLFRIPVSMGVGYDESAVTDAFLSVTNGDGRTDTLTIGWAPSPDMEIYGLELVGGGSVFDLSDMNGNGLVLNFRVFGKYLHAGRAWTLTGPSPATGSWGTGNYGSEAFIVINPISMQTGFYTLSLDGTFYAYSFTLVP